MKRCLFLRKTDNVECYTTVSIPHSHPQGLMNYNAIWRNLHSFLRERDWDREWERERERIKNVSTIRRKANKHYLNGK